MVGELLYDAKIKISVIFVYNSDGLFLFYVVLGNYLFLE